MLKQLYIKNFTLIDELNIQFHQGFSVITGETGAGKSIILGAIALLLGQRADSKSIKQGCHKCVVEAHFDLSRYDMREFFLQNDIDYDDTDCIIRREINSNGKSRGFINDQPAAIGLMRELGEHLIDIHSQHQNLLLNKEDFQLNIVDILAKDDDIRQAYRQSYEAYKAAVAQLEALKEEIQKNLQNEDFLRFQTKELEEANLVAGEQEELETLTQMLNHAEEIKSSLYNTSNILIQDDGGLVNSLKEACANLHNIEEVFPEIKEQSQRLEACFIELKDISHDVDRQVDKIDFDPKQLDDANLRLDTIYTLEKKYHAATTEELIEILAELKKRIELFDHSDENLKRQQEIVEKLEATCRQQAAKLSRQRSVAAKKIETELLKRLVPLGIAKARFSILLQEKPLSHDGQDKISFLFSANSTTDMQPISQVASGGEIARVMLSLKAMISGAVKLPTIIFDEIDTGVSGRAAEMMGQIMYEMGLSNRQVISITHLPQIAARGTTHYKVSKEETDMGTISNMKILTTEERVAEIAQMLSGSNITEAAISNAKDLLNIK
ncbi:DNA repair protein RecN [Prevotella sp. A2931]|uniref:DNA repair protein RecN n=1 Tax=Prevotella illustrans TaxID=2800387 RepID=A0ABS3M6H1_9BACT|nr:MULTISPECIES: DNA repair protein RecN [Prevotella]MBO1363734.1 DNA repair protein RecN [Prevotella illustrans]PTL25305.1 DNA repair protein RecN [Prevotella sp. oral taxon 820]